MNDTRNSFKCSYRCNFDNYQEAGEICLAIGKQNNWAVAFGWGYDKEMPLRPWPQYHTSFGSKSGALIRSISLLGLYFTWGY